jgi:hypothetical protein
MKLSSKWIKRNKTEQRYNKYNKNMMKTMMETSPPHERWWDVYPCELPSLPSFDQIHMYTYIHTYKCMIPSIYIYVCIYLYIYTYTYVYIYAFHININIGPLCAVCSAHYCFSSSSKTCKTCVGTIKLLHKWIFVFITYAILAGFMCFT